MKLVRPAVLLLAAAFAAAAGPARADFADIKKAGKLRVLAVDEDLFLSTRPRALPGFDREVLDGFAKLHRLQVELVPLASWDAMIPSLLEGKGDLIAGGYSITDERKKQIAFSAEVFPSRKVVMTRKPSPVVKSLEELRGVKVVGTVKGTSMSEAVHAAGVAEANIQYFVSGTLPAMLKEGKADAVVLGVEHAILAQREDPAIQIGLFLGTPGSLAYGLRKDDVELKKALDEYVSNLRRTETWNRLVVKYLGTAAPDVLKQARDQK